MNRLSSFLQKQCRLFAHQAKILQHPISNHLKSQWVKAYIILPKSSFPSASIQKFNNCHIIQRCAHTQQEKQKRSTVYYVIAVLVFVTGLSYAAVPLYRLYCQATSYGGTISTGHDVSKILENPKEAKKDRLITVKFNADTASSLTWNFRPQQTELVVPVGETALAFYTAKNPTEHPIDGISTYNVIPFEAGLYFNKIQCFCFEEQRLNPHEQVDLPVFFYIDPEFVDDPKLENVDSIVLSYTFFEAKDTEKFQNLPIFQHNRG
ncbi:cytochrome c oxidase assembly protein ctaG-like [Artemia franciscana]|uniref:Cytochrome c oxidase assembly protein COX11, mitochondrial n=1 Tax=Artemia franciscana TaxID=6661 RepID=A0AA88IL05_ARTSF|nr:hypothetical protein QYM36_000266 [Artemia franciscana]KAK2725712.1 hypothetical protein QYM36_000266 [Artemia franciscana]KAK2725713.1 hypothetical protein QYM36_000266 [Artemia franciscana]KAK2725714.1 hypothetical protein QYM36_000266 [Artemia franciscana]KAK2725715.1 hypothetical protein QYM36_000266 [Artemia franciscana]